MPGSLVSSILRGLKLWISKPCPMKKSNLKIEKQPAAADPPAAPEALAPIEPGNN